MKKTLLILCVLLGSVITATADDVVTVSNIDIPKGAKGSFSIDLTNTTTTFTGYEMVLTLPQGVTFSAAKLGDRYSSDHSCQANNPYEQDNQKTKIVVSSASSALITGKSGSLLTIEVEVADNVSVGELTGASLTGIKFSTGTLSTLSDVNFNLNITDGIFLDEESTVLPAEQSSVDVTMNRTLKANVWNTLCLPFEITASNLQNAVNVAGGDGTTTAICELTDYTYTAENGTIELEFTTLDNTIPANYPILVKPTNNVTSIDFSNVSLAPNESDASKSSTVEQGKGASKKPVATFIGTLRAGTTIPADDIYLGSDNKFYYSKGSTTIKGFRGYFWLKDFRGDSSAGARQINLVVDGEEATAIEGLYINGEPVVKGVYNLKGQRVDTPTQKGIYIKDGKKVVIK